MRLDGGESEGFAGERKDEHRRGHQHRYVGRRGDNLFQHIIRLYIYWHTMPKWPEQRPRATK